MEKINTEKSGQPGVSGKDQNGKTWINAEEYHQQVDQLEDREEAEKGFAQSTGSNLMGRSDLENQGYENSASVEENQVFEALKRSPELDVSHVRVRMDGSVVYLEGTVDDANEARGVKKVVENIPGVSKVISHLYILTGTEEI